jgi:hypothetical protein
MDVELVRKRMSEMTDAELERALSVEAESYDPEALALMRAELSSRVAAAPASAPRTPPAALDPVAPTAEEKEREQFARRSAIYRPAPVLTGALVALVGLQLLASLGILVGYAVQRHLIEEDVSEGWLFDIANTAIDSGGVVRQLSYIAAIVVFLVWVHRMYVNLGALGSESVRYTPGGAVGAFFIPFVNLVRGYQVIHHLWLESQPQPAVLPDGVPLARSAPLVGWWWGFHIGANLVARLATNKATSIEGWVQESWFSSLWLLVLGLGGVLFLQVVRGVARRQRDQWDDIVRRQPAPVERDRLR